MITHFITLQWKSFWRSASMSSGLFMKLFMGFWALWFIVMMGSGGVGAFFLIEEKLNLDPLVVINELMVYWIVMDLIFRYALQKMPVINIKPLLILPFNKRKIVSFAFGKTIFSFFNIIHAFFFIPFSVVLVQQDYPIANVLLWNIGLIALIYSSNFLNIILNKKDNLIFIIGGVLALCIGL